MNEKLICASACEGHKHYKTLTAKEVSPNSTIKFDDVDLQILANEALLSSKYNRRTLSGERFAVIIMQVEPVNGHLHHRKLCQVYGHIPVKCYAKESYEDEKAMLLKKVPKMFADTIQSLITEFNGNYASKLDKLEDKIKEIEEAINFHFKGVLPIQ